MSHRVCGFVNAFCACTDDCAARLTDSNCWEVENADCCRRNDKSRCCYCSVYLAYLAGLEGDPLLHVDRFSREDARFAEMNREFYHAHRHPLAEHWLHLTPVARTLGLEA